MQRFLKDNLTTAFAELKALFPHITMSPKDQEKAKDAIMRLVYVMKDGYVTTAKAEIGMIRCGYALPYGVAPTRVFAGFENSTVNAYRILTELCSYGFSKEELDLIYLHGPVLIAFFIKHGRLTTVIMDQCGLPKVTWIESRDDRCISQQGNDHFPPYVEVPSVIKIIIAGPLNLTHADTLARSAAYADRSAAKEQTNKLAAAKILVEKADADDIQKQKIEAEKRRVAALSPAEKQAHKEAKQLVSSEKKKQSSEKKASKQRTLDNARQMVAGPVVLASAGIPEAAALGVTLGNAAADPMEL